MFCDVPVGGHAHWGSLEDEASVQFVSVVFNNLPGTQAGLMTATVAWIILMSGWIRWRNCSHMRGVVLGGRGLTDHGTTFIHWLVCCREITLRLTVSWMTALIVAQVTLVSSSSVSRSAPLRCLCSDSERRALWGFSTVTLGVAESIQAALICITSLTTPSRAVVCRHTSKRAAPTRDNPPSPFKQACERLNSEKGFFLVCCVFLSGFVARN